MNGERQTIAFNETLPEYQNILLVSKRIPYPYKLVKIRAHFPLGTDRKLQLQYYLSPDKSEDVTHGKTGINVLHALGYSEYITGDNNTVEIECSIEVPEAGTYVKVYATNEDVYEHTVDVQAIIEPLERR